MAYEPPRGLHVISLIVLGLIGIFAAITALDRGFRGDGALNGIAAAVAFGMLALASKPRSNG